MLPGIPDAALWVVVTLYIIGALLVYFGSISRGRQKFLAMFLGLAIIGFAAYPPFSRYVLDNPKVRACVEIWRATGSLNCERTP